jgi:hypothetical protein
MQRRPLGLVFSSQLRQALALLLLLIASSALHAAPNCVAFFVIDTPGYFPTGQAACQALAQTSYFTYPPFGHWAIGTCVRDVCGPPRP